jgi:hypothetical protein
LPATLETKTMSPLVWILTIWGLSFAIVVGYLYVDILRKNPEEN